MFTLWSSAGRVMPMTDEVERMRIGAKESADEIERLQLTLWRMSEALDRIVRHYDARSELYISDAELAEGMAALARLALADPAER